MCEIMIMNVAKMLRDRMVLQNAADNAAMAAAVNQARVMNDLAYLNLMIACTLENNLPEDKGFFNGLLPPLGLSPVFGGLTQGQGTASLFGIPVPNPFTTPGGGLAAGPPSFTGPVIDGLGVANPLWSMNAKNDISGIGNYLDVFPADIMAHGGIQYFSHVLWPASGPTQSIAIQAMKTAVELLITLQDAIMATAETPGLSVTDLVAYKVAERAERGPDGTWWGPGVMSTVITPHGLGLERNRQKIAWYGMKHWWVCTPGVPLINTPSAGVWWVETDKVADSDKSWLIKDGNPPSNSGSLTVSCTRGPGEKSNKSYPLGNFNIKWPTIYVKATACWVNSTGNIGFPVHTAPFDVDTAIMGDRYVSPYQAYIGDDEPGDFTDSDGWNGGRWFAQLIKSPGVTH